MSGPAASGASPPLPWHEGEIRLQRLTGFEARMGELGPKVIRRHLIEQHREFYPLLPMVVLGSVDAQGRAWATLRAGPPGFLRAPDAHHLRVELRPDPHDPAEAGMQDGTPIALLGIDLGTRRRNRLNGRLRRTPHGFDLLVEESFGNCPKYIQSRTIAFSRDPGLPSTQAATILAGLDDAARSLIGQADTFFVASFFDGNGVRRVDVSHRGGRPGFVALGSDGWLTIPDFQGNHFYNTLGNISLNRKAGLVFVDFGSGTLLQMTGEAELLTGPPAHGMLQGAERYWRFRPSDVIWRPAALPLRFSFTEMSPFAAATSVWRQSAA
jgi:hypothetical protein